MMRLRRKLRDWVLTFSILGLVALVVVFINLKGAHEFSGPFYAVDGDSLRSSDQSLRLSGIDAPELDQYCGSMADEWACGRIARQKLSQMVSGADVRCISHGLDRYDRWLVTCLNGVRKINASMVEQGWAIGYHDYESEEAEARDLGLGIWSGEFERPQDWRAANRASSVGDGQEIQLFQTIELRLREFWWLIKRNFQNEKVQR